MASFIQNLTESGRTNMDNRTQVNLQGEPFKTFKFSTDNFQIQHQATVISQKNIGGDVLIWGNDAFGCFTPDTEILTTEGIKLVKDCKVGDMVYSVNPETLKTEIKPVIDTQKYDYSGPMYHFVSDRIDYLVTPEHKMFLKKKRALNFNSYIDEPQFIRAEDVTKVKHYVPEHKKGDFGNRHNPDLLYFYGIYLSEGCLIHNIRKGRSNGYSVNIAQYEEVNPDICRKIEGCLDRLGIKYKQEKRKKHYDIHSREIYYQLLSLFGTGSNDKHIPNSILEEYDEESLLALYQGMYDGDGTKKVLRYSTKSTKLRDGFIQLITRLGFRWRYSSEISKKFGTRIWRICFKKGDNNACISPKNQKIVPYSGEVVCVTVQDNHTVLVGRNGKFDWCGQCWGSFKWGTTASQSFILGLSLLGVNALGDKSSEYEIVRVSPPNNSFNEPFLTDYFIDTDETTATVGTEVWV